MSVDGRMARFLLLNGPNLNLLGQREPDVYGSDTLASIEERAKNAAARLGHEVIAFQSNAEHELIDRVQTAKANGISFAILNPGGFTHTSVALRDALLGVKLPFIELHLSNTFAREKFRHHSYFSDIAVGCIVGLGALGYELAIQAAAARVAAR
jgi:3-dehydroquinate dehydratase-2